MIGRVQSGNVKKLLGVRAASRVRLSGADVPAQVKNLVVETVASEKIARKMERSLEADGEGRRLRVMVQGAPRGEPCAPADAALSEHLR